MTGIWIEKLPRGGGRLIAILAAATLLALACLIPVGQAQAQTVPLKYAIEINVQAGDTGLGVVRFEDENGNEILLGQGETRTVMVDAGDDFALTATPGNLGQFDFIKFDGVLMDIGSDQSNWTNAYSRVLDRVDRNHRYDFAFVNRSAPFAGIPDTIGEDKKDPFLVGMAYEVTGSPAFGNWDMQGSPLVQLYDGRAIDLSDGSVWIRALQPGTTTAQYGGGNKSPTPKNVDITIGANTTNEHYIFALAHVGGQIDLPGNQKVEAGESKTFTVMPDNGYWIKTLEVDGKDVPLTAEQKKGNYSYTFTNVQGPHDIVATFEEAAELTMVKSLEGLAGDTILNVEPNPNYGAWIYDDEYVDVERRLEGADWVFDLTLKKAGDTELTYQVKGLAQKVQLKIHPSHNIAATAGPGGSIDPQGNVKVEVGGDKTFTIEPDDGYSIGQVVADGADVTQQLVNNGYTFSNVTEDHAIRATFEEIKGVEDTVLFVGESVDMTPSPAGGAWTVGDPSVVSLSEQGGTATFTALKAGTTTISYAVNGGVREAAFTVKPIHTVSAWAGVGGVINPKGDVKVKDGDDLAFTVTPDPLMMVDKLLVDGQDVTSQMQGDSYTLKAVSGDRVVRATFKKLVIGELPMEFEIPAGGSADFRPTPPGGTWTVDDGTVLSITEQGSTATITGLKIGTTKVTYTVNGVSHKMSVTVVPATYTIKATAGKGGTVRPSGNVVVAYGADQTFTVTPETGYKLERLLVDGKDATLLMKGSSYTFQKVKADHTIEASFVQLAATKQLVGTGDTALPALLVGIGALAAGVGAAASKKLRRR